MAYGFDQVMLASLAIYLLGLLALTRIPPPPTHVAASAPGR
jgi:hypothetical protein